VQIIKYAFALGRDSREGRSKYGCCFGSVSEQWIRLVSIQDNKNDLAATIPRRSFLKQTLVAGKKSGS
jgi:hypothetical protein